LKQSGNNPVSSTPSVSVSTIIPAQEIRDLPLSPAVGHIVNSLSLDVSSIGPGTGKDGRLTKADVILALKDGKAKKIDKAPTSTAAVSGSPVAESKSSLTPPSFNLTQPLATSIPAPPSRGFTDLPLSAMRRVIATRLSQSKKECPHLYVSRAVKMDQLASLRKKIKGIQ